MATMEDASHLNGTPVQVASDYNNQYNHIQLPSSTCAIETHHDFRHRQNFTGCNVEKSDGGVGSFECLLKSSLPSHSVELAHLFAVIINICKQEVPWSARGSLHSNTDQLKSQAAFKAAIFIYL